MYKKSYIIIVAIALVLGFSAAGSLTGRGGAKAPPLHKVGTVDMTKAVQDYSYYKEQREKLQDEVDKKRKKLEEQQKEIQNMMEELQAGRGTVGEKKLSQMQELIQYKSKALNASVAKVQQELTEKESDLMAMIEKELREVVAEIGAKQGFDLVLRSEVVLYNSKDESVDLTAQVTKELNTRRAKQQ